MKESNVVQSVAAGKEKSTPANGSKTYFQLIRERFFRHRLAVGGLTVLVIIGLTVLFAPFIIPHDPYQSDFTAFSAPPGPGHPLGTDSIGRDIFARLIYGGRVSLAVGLVSTTISALLGIPLGLYAGFRGGFADALIMRIADTFMSIPAIMLILVLVAVIGPNIWSVMGVLGIIGWHPFARLIRCDRLV